MNRQNFRILLLPVMIGFGLIFTVINVAAQCGLPGTPSCPPKNPPASTKSSSGNTAKASIDRENAERERLERQRILRARLKRKALEKQKGSETPQWLKNVVEYNKTMKTAKTLELFPVEKVVLGKTGTALLSLLGENCGITGDDGKLTNCYRIEAIYFYCDENNISDSLYLSRLRLQGMPENWKQIGFDWDLSYNEWMSLLKQQGYLPFPAQEPTVVLQSGKKFLKAEVLTVVKVPNGTARLTLSFNYGFGKTTVNDKGTLFSIALDKSN